MMSRQIINEAIDKLIREEVVVKARQIGTQRLLWKRLLWLIRR